MLKPSPQWDGISRCGLQRRLGQESGALLNGICTLRRETPEGSLSLPPCVDTVRKGPSVSQEEGSYQTLSVPETCTWTSSLHDYEKYISAV